MQCRVTRRQEEDEIKGDVRDGGSENGEGDDSPRWEQGMKSEQQRSGDSRGGSEGDVGSDILLPARAKIISRGRNVQAD